MKKPPRPPGALPHRANGIRTLAAQMAQKKLAEIMARQGISDRIGYLVAVVIGAGVFYRFGWKGVVLVLAVYSIAVVNAYRQWRAHMRSAR